MIKKHIHIILCVLGCIIIITAVLLKCYTKYEQKMIVDNYRNYILNMKNQDETYNVLSKEDNNSSPDADVKTKTKSQSQESKETPSPLIKDKNIIGILSIPKIDLCVGIAEGTDRKALKYTVGHFVGTAKPGEKGNLCIAGHRSYSYGEFFNRLDEIAENDLITVESEGKTFHYKVTDTMVIKPEEVSVLEQTDDVQITLITCTPIRVGSHRLIIKGVLLDER